MTNMQIDHAFLEVHASILTHRHRTFQIPRLSVVTLSDFSDKGMLTSVGASETSAEQGRVDSFSPLCSSPQIIDKLFSQK